MHTKEEVFALLSEIPDPEIPVISIVELGVIREILIEGTHIEVFITPTYSCLLYTSDAADDIL
jgi:ring-1,2-phenylacetyl-CoA epoxidase subunit PaaD